MDELETNDHISTGFNVEVQNLDGNFDEAIARVNPCESVVVVYHITPDTGEAFEFNENSVCQHVDAETNETQCDVHTIVLIDCNTNGGPNGSGGYDDDGGEVVTWNYGSGSSDNDNNDSDYKFVTGSSPKAPLFTKSFIEFLTSLPQDKRDFLNSSLENFHFKLELQNLFQINGYDNEAQLLATYLIDLRIDDPNFNFEAANNASEENFFEIESTLEIEDVLSQVNSTFEYSSDQDEPFLDTSDGKTKIIFKGEFPTVFPLYLNIHVSTELDDEETESIDEFELDSVTSFDSGLTTFIDWNQDSYEITSEGETFVELTIYGHFEYGFKILGTNITIVENWVVVVVFNKKTGEAVDMDAYSE